MVGEIADLFHGGSDTGLLLLIAALAFFFKRQLRIYDRHIEKCEELPKGQILTTLDNVCVRMDDLRDTVKDIAAKQDTMGFQVSQLIGRQIERDNKHS